MNRSLVVVAKWNGNGTNYYKSHDFSHREYKIRTSHRSPAPEETSLSINAGRPGALEDVSFVMHYSGNRAASAWIQSAGCGIFREPYFRPNKGNKWSKVMTPSIRTDSTSHSQLSNNLLVAYREDPPKLLKKRAMNSLGQCNSPIW